VQGRDDQSRDDPGRSDVGDVVRLSDAATLRELRRRESRRRVALVERLAQVQVHADAIARSALELATETFPAMVEALELVLADAKRSDGAGEEASDGVCAGVGGVGGDAVADSGVVLERLVRADPVRARRVLDSMAGADGEGC
jgi:hypothetical protein